MTDDTLDLRAYFDVLIRRWKFVLAMPILAMIAAALVSFAVKPTYEATAVLGLAPVTVSVPTTSQAPPYYLMVTSPSNLPTAYTPTYYIALLEGNDVVSQVAPQVPVTIDSNGSDKSLIDITARGGDPQQVTATANKWMQQGAARIQKALLPSQDQLSAAQAQLDEAEQALVKFSKDNGLDYNLNRLRAATFSSSDNQVELGKLLRAYDVAESVYVGLAENSERENILATSTYAPSLIAAAVPTTPVSPKPVQNILIGAALGLLLGILGAFALEWVAR
jgi:capsular polysaccharide biosynthesis protein